MDQKRMYTFMEPKFKEHFKKFRIIFNFQREM